MWHMLPCLATASLQLHDVFVSFSGNLYLVFELLERDLKQAMDAVRHRGGLEEDLVRVYLYQLLTASAPARAGRCTCCGAECLLCRICSQPPWHDC